MNFRVSTLEGNPPTSGREGDVEDEDENDPEFVVDTYMAGVISLDPTAEYAVESEEEFSDY